MDVGVARETIPRLSKSRFMSGLQCPKRLWLESYARDLAPPPDPWTEANLETGRAVGELARHRFPGGRLVAQDHLRHEEAEELTRLLLADPSVPAIYEAAFTHDDIRIRADVLARTNAGRFDLFEVKATTSVKPEHLWDVAVQLHVLEGARVPVRRAHLMHLDRDYVHEGGDYDLSLLYAAADLTEAARGLNPEVVGRLGAMRESLRRESPPVVAVGAHCTAPYTCPFYDHCHEEVPGFPVEALPHARAALLERLRELGIADIREIPVDLDGFSLIQARVIEAVRTGRRFHDPAVRDALSAVAFPVHFLDFETFMPALPLFPGTRPYDTIPFQWSDHVLDGDGSVTHREYLHEGRDDPRPRFVETLLEATAGAGSVVVYSSYEATCIHGLESALPGEAARLERLRGRLFDLRPVIREHVYDPEFHGSFSLKRVLPALLPHLSYDDLAIGEGSLASLAYLELRRPETPPERVARLRADLLAYCGRDTEALLELFRLLR